VHGRRVAAGHGVDPDIAVVEALQGRIERLLVTKGVFFDFASQWCREHPLIVQRMSSELLARGDPPASATSPATTTVRDPAPQVPGAEEEIGDTRGVTRLIQQEADRIWADFSAYMSDTTPQGGGSFLKSEVSMCLEYSIEWNLVVVCINTCHLGEKIIRQNDEASSAEKNPCVAVLAKHTRAVHRTRSAYANDRKSPSALVSVLVATHAFATPAS
jgi:hypothetical protein